MGKYGYSVYIGGISDRVRTGDVEDFFKGYGKILDISLKSKFGKDSFESKKNRILFYPQGFTDQVVRKSPRILGSSNCRCLVLVVSVIDHIIQVLSNLKTNMTPKMPSRIWMTQNFVENESN